MDRWIIFYDNKQTLTNKKISGSIFSDVNNWFGFGLASLMIAMTTNLPSPLLVQLMYTVYYWHTNVYYWFNYCWSWRIQLQTNIQKIYIFYAFKCQVSQEKNAVKMHLSPKTGNNNTFSHSNTSGSFHCSCRSISDIQTHNRDFWGHYEDITKRKRRRIRGNPTHDASISGTNCRTHSYPYLWQVRGLCEERVCSWPLTPWRQFSVPDWKSQQRAAGPPAHLSPWSPPSPGSEKKKKKRPWTASKTSLQWLTLLSSWLKTMWPCEFNTGDFESNVSMGCHEMWPSQLTTHLDQSSS